MDNIGLGKQGEDIAASHLAQIGYRIIERNFKKKHGDIDIVALDGDTLVFIEVKTRRSKTFGSPFDAITPWKLSSLIKSANLYAMLHTHLPKAHRIDVVSVNYTQSSTPKVELIKNVTG